MIMLKGRCALAGLGFNHLNAIDDNCRKKMTAHYCYFLDTEDKLSAIEIQQVEKLLPIDSITSINVNDSTGAWLVPRLGTVSPWSSKATDIFHHCGLLKVKRIERGVFYCAPSDILDPFIKNIVDPLTESVIHHQTELVSIFQARQSKPSAQIDLLTHGIEVLHQANQSLGLALTQVEVQYLYQLYLRLKRNPFQSELMMFAQVNSEHCRHKIFNASWTIDEVEQQKSLFAMIRHTHSSHQDNVLVAYHDNAAVLTGYDSTWLLADEEQACYQYRAAKKPIVLKVETHNHPTAISPFPGAATGSGGEIRDEAATGRGSKSKAGLVGFSVSDLLIPDFNQPWERNIGKPTHMASAMQIMLEAPIGAAAFNNEFGRPNLCGYFRTLLTPRWDEQPGAYCGYHKPIMIAGGIGNIHPTQLEKKDIPVGSLLVVLGGPAFAIGLGGGSASSRVSSTAHQALDFASVQRANPEMQRRCQQVITACYSCGENNPILSIHDVGAGGLSNALPELVEAAKKGAQLHLRDIILGDQSLSPVEIWCNESQERFVLAILPEALPQLRRYCQRERCPFSVVGQATLDQQLILSDSLVGENVIDLPMPALFEKMPSLCCEDKRRVHESMPIAFDNIDLTESIQRVLQLPSVASKRFLITIGDRSVGGLVTRDQMVGPWQVPVADVAVTCSDFCGFQGEAMAMGERAPLAVLDQAASARMAVAEAILNIAATNIKQLSDISLSANWMAAPNVSGEGAGLYDAVEAIAMQMCPALGIAIPVGKDSLSMQCAWEHQAETRSVTSPLSLVITAAAKVEDVRKTLTPELSTQEDTVVVLVDVSQGRQALGATAFAQVHQLSGGLAADVHCVDSLKFFFNAIQACQQAGLLLAYHDRSDGGLLTTLVEMMFASHCGLSCDLSSCSGDVLPLLFNEELGAVIQCKQSCYDQVVDIFQAAGLSDVLRPFAQINDTDELILKQADQPIYRQSRVTLQRHWEQTSYEMAKRRDNPSCVQQEYDSLLDSDDPGLSSVLTFVVDDSIKAPSVRQQKPKVAILREQGVNGHLEMAAAFMQAGFEAVDVHMSDILAGHRQLDEFSIMAVCGGFSYGDVLGAGRGWALTVLSNPRAYDQFSAFFQRTDTLTLGVCNGCQMLSHLRELIPGAAHWPQFLANQSQQFEARFNLVKIMPSPALMLQGMQNSVMPVVVSHGEGRAVFPTEAALAERVTLRYVDHHHQISERYPFNPNGSAGGITGLCSDDGRVLIMMPHPERVFRSVQCSWRDPAWGALSPWSKLFQNARNLF